MKILLDINVVLDVLANREPHARASAAVLSLVEADVIEGVIAAHTVTTLHYLLRQELDAKEAATELSRLLRIVGVVPVDEALLRRALAMDWSDFEDAVQAACAENGDVDYLVTRDEEGFRDCSVRVISPAALRALIASLPENDES